jgi:hypothetical protein
VCNRTFRIRAKKRGRKLKREQSIFAERVLRLGASIRGIADMKSSPEAAIRRRFHRSVQSWKRTHKPAEPFTEDRGFLIIVADGIYFTFEEEEYVCLMILVRPTQETRARLRGLVIMKGDESKEHWEEAFERVLTPLEEAQIKGIVADGSHGLVSLCKERGWVYQRCHFHLLGELKNFCSGHKNHRTRELRKRIFDLVREILDTPDEKEMRMRVKRLSRLTAHPECPRTVRKKISGFLKHLERYRTCYRYPELNLPKTSNSAECVGRLIRKMLSRMHGVRTLKSLEYWLDIVLRLHPEIQCNGFRNTPN